MSFGKGLVVGAILSGVASVPGTNQFAKDYVKDVRAESAKAEYWKDSYEELIDKWNAAAVQCATHVRTGISNGT